jgi:Kef-type K+ transport system membrane component KefB
VEATLVNDIALCIVVAWLLAVAAQILRQPLLIAYLGAGFAIGPVGLAWIQNRESIKTIAELGLIFLLFMIGLEIDLKKMVRAGRSITVTAMTQVGGGLALGLGFFWLCGFGLGGGSLDALYLAVAATMSSTVIIVKLLYDKRELDTVVGRLTLGVLVLQDVFAILFLALQPNLRDPQVLPLLFSLGKVAALGLVAYGASRYVLPVLFRNVARLPELVLVGALAWCFFMVKLAGGLALSHEMGALVAGVSISTFPYALDVGARITSIRDFFVTLFFVSLGMMIPAPTWQQLLWAMIFSLFVLASRLMTVFPPLYLMKFGHRASVLPTVNLCQISEFSLVIMALGLAAGHVQPGLVAIVAYAFVLLAVDSTYAIQKSENIANWVSQWLKRLRLLDLDQDGGEADRGQQPPRIVLLGFFRAASSLLEELRLSRPSLLTELLVVDFNPHVFTELRGRGLRVTYGDITRRETLEHAGVPAAKIIICTLPTSILKGATNLKLLRQLRELNPAARILMHAESAEEAREFYAAGASYVCLARLLEAAEISAALEAASDNLLDEKRAAMIEKLDERNEVVS